MLVDIFNNPFRSSSARPIGRFGAVAPPRPKAGEDIVDLGAKPRRENIIYNWVG